LADPGLSPEGPQRTRALHHSRLPAWGGEIPRLSLRPPAAPPIRCCRPVLHPSFLPPPRLPGCSLARGLAEPLPSAAWRQPEASRKSRPTPEQLRPDAFPESRPTTTAAYRRRLAQDPRHGAHVAPAEPAGLRHPTLAKASPIQCARQPLLDIAGPRAISVTRRAAALPNSSTECHFSVLAGQVKSGIVSESPKRVGPRGPSNGPEPFRRSLSGPLATSSTSSRIFSGLNRRGDALSAQIRSRHDFQDPLEASPNPLQRVGTESASTGRAWDFPAPR